MLVGFCKANSMHNYDSFTEEEKRVSKMNAFKKIEYLKNFYGPEYIDEDYKKFLYAEAREKNFYNNLKKNEKFKDKVIKTQK